MLTQIIVEEESKGRAMLPTGFLRQLIGFYGDSLQTLVPRYLEQSMQSLTSQQDKFREQMAQAFGNVGFGPMEEQVRRNMELFQQTFSMFKPLTPRSGELEKVAEPAPERDTGNIDDLRKQMKDMQDRLERMSKDTKKEE